MIPAGRAGVLGSRSTAAAGIAGRWRKTEVLWKESLSNISVVSKSAVDGQCEFGLPVGCHKCPTRKPYAERSPSQAGALCF